MKCINCNKVINNEFAFCPNCGTKVEESKNSNSNEITTNMTLLEFRNFSKTNDTYKKSLNNFREDLKNNGKRQTIYNAFVAILLGDTGMSRKPSCKNMAIGQGMRKDIVKEKILDIGLYDAFEKYRQDNQNSTIKEVVDEILRTSLLDISDIVKGFCQIVFGETIIKVETTEEKSIDEDFQVEKLVKDDLVINKVEREESLTKIYDMKLFDKQNLIGDYILEIKEIEEKNQYKFEFLKRSNTGYGHGERVFVIKREKGDKVISNIIIWDDYIYFIKGDSFNRPSIVKAKINGKKIIPLLNEIEFENLMKERGYSNLESLKYLRLYLKDENLYMSSIINSEYFALDMYNQNKHLQCVNLTKIDEQNNKGAKPIGVSENGDVVILISGVNKDKVIVLKDKESIVIDMSLFNERMTNAFDWYSYKDSPSIKYYLENQKRKPVSFWEVLDEVLYYGNNDIYVKVNIERTYDKIMPNTFNNYFDYSYKKDDRYFIFSLEEHSEFLHSYIGVMRIMDSGRIIESVPSSRFSEDYINASKDKFSTFSYNSEFKFNPLKHARFMLFNKVSQEDFNRVKENLTIFEQSLAMKMEENNFWEKEVNLDYFNVISEDIDNKYWIVDCDFCYRRTILRVSFDGRSFAESIQDNWNYEYPDYNSFKTLEIPEKPYKPITPVPYDSEQYESYCSRVLNKKSKFEIEDFIYEFEVDLNRHSERKKWYWSRKGSTKKTPIYEVNQYYGAKIVQIYKGIIYFTHDDKLCCLKNGKIEELIHLPSDRETVTDINIYNDKIFISKYYDGTDPSDGFIPSTGGEIVDYHQHDRGEINLYTIDGRYIERLWSKYGLGSTPPNVTAVNQNEIVFGDSTRYRFEY